jgi:hypothetical protein
MINLLIYLSAMPVSIALGRTETAHKLIGWLNEKPRGLEKHPDFKFCVGYIMFVSVAGSGLIGLMLLTDLLAPALCVVSSQWCYPP